MIFDIFVAIVFLLIAFFGVDGWAVYVFVALSAIIIILCDVQYGKLCKKVDELELELKVHKITHDNLDVYEKHD